MDTYTKIKTYLNWSVFGPSFYAYCHQVSLTYELNSSHVIKEAETVEIQRDYDGTFSVDNSLLLEAENSGVILVAMNTNAVSKCFELSLQNL